MKGAEPRPDASPAVSSRDAPPADARPPALLALLVALSAGVALAVQNGLFLDGTSAGGTSAGGTSAGGTARLAVGLVALFQGVGAVLVWRAGRSVLAAGLALATLATASSFVVSQRAALSESSLQVEIASSYEGLWQELEELADTMSLRLAPLTSGRDRDALFSALRQAVRGAADYDDLGVLLFDSDGEAVSWYGAGLLHEPEAYELPRSGRTYRRGFTAVTVLLVQPIGDDRRPWRLVLGRSLPLEDFPFASFATGAGRLRWSLGAPDATAPDVTAPEHTWRFTSGDAGEDGPALYVETGQVADAVVSSHEGAMGERRDSARTDSLPALLQRLGLLLVASVSIAAGLLAVGGGEKPPPAARLSAVVSLSIGALGLAVASGAATSTLVAVALVVTLSSASLAAGGFRRRGPSAMLELAAVWILAWLGVVFLERRLGVGIHSSELFSVDAGWLALLVALLVLSRLLAIEPAGSSGEGPWLMLSLLALAAGAAVHDQTSAGVFFGALGCAGAARWWQGLERRPSRPRRFAALALVAALAGGLAWQTAHRSVIRHYLETDVLPTLGPPETDELNEILIELHAFFDGLDVMAVTPPPRVELPDPGDLPYALWRRSPLTHHDGLSAVMIEDERGRRRLFSFGLAFGSDFEPLPSPARWPVPDVPAWRDALMQGDGRLFFGEEGWGRVRFWYLPRPGFRRRVDELHELESNLVRGKPRHETADGLPEGVLYALYDADGEARSSPWDEAPPLAQEVVAGAPCHRRPTPDGDAWCWSSGASDGVETLFLPELGPQAAIERVGSWAMALFPLLVLLGAVGFSGGAGRSGHSSSGLLELWRSSMRSYPRRLALVFTLLLMVPLIALNFVFLRSVAERLRQEQLADARDAMVSARTLLLDYLRGLEPGFLIETQVNRELLDWIGGLVGHQVNLYWGSRLYASSQQELFTAGLLPRRIPGEIFTQLSLFGYELGFRRQRAGDLAYLEVYAPVDVPDIVSSQQELFLSVPLLEQEEEAARELAAMRARALLLSSGLLLLTLAVAGRLSRRFTEPIVQLIGSTRRIARGETYTPVEPRETELVSLARAIDTMAEQVAASRRGLEREKQFIERVVASITSAVVSLDRERRVLLHNRVAEELLGTEIGELLEDVLARHEHLEPLRDFLVEAGEEPRRRQVKLRPADERVDVYEWSLTWVPIPGSEDPAALLVIDDTTEVMRGQRLETWAEMARIIAHEIKNPLTPIQLSTEHMVQVYKVDPSRFEDVLASCSRNILRNVAELRQIASEFSTYSRIPAAELEPGDLVASMRELAANYLDASRVGVEVAFAAAVPSLETRFDARLLGRAVRNLIENALRETAEDGGLVRVEVDVEEDAGEDAGEATVPGEAERGWALVRVIDSGPGVDPQKLERIFEPYFSTYESGTGLGLAITRRIVEEHGGNIEARNRPGGGLVVVIRIPRTGDQARPEG